MEAEGFRKMYYDIEKTVDEEYARKSIAKILALENAKMVNVKWKSSPNKELFRSGDGKMRMREESCSNCKNCSASEHPLNELLTERGIKPIEGEMRQCRWHRFRTWEKCWCPSYEAGEPSDSGLAETSASKREKRWRPRYETIEESSGSGTMETSASKRKESLVETRREGLRMGWETWSTSEEIIGTGTGLDSSSPSEKAPEKTKNEAEENGVDSSDSKLNGLLSQWLMCIGFFFIVRFIIYLIFE